MKGNISASQNLQIQEAEEQLCFPMTYEDWQDVENKINDLKIPPKWLGVLANFFIGVCSSSIVTRVALPDDVITGNSNISLTLGIVIGVSGVVAVICYVLDHQLTETNIKREKEHIISLMVRIKRPYKNRFNTKKAVPDTNEDNKQNAVIKEQNNIEELIPFIKMAWNRFKDKSGWANVCPVYNFIQQECKADFKPQDYGAKKMPELLEKLSQHFEVKRSGGKGTTVITFKVK